MNQTLQTLTQRKSVRNYQARHVEPALLDQILAAGLAAPSGMNRQTPRFVAVTKDETVQKLSQMNAAVGGFATDPFYGAKDVIVVLAKKEGTYLYDGSLAMGNLLNAAYALGVDSCWIHRAKEVFANDEGKTLLQQWGIDEDVEGIGFCILGYAADDKAKPSVKEGRVFRAE